MSRIAYVNGQYVPHGQAMVHVEDRGYQFSDGVYEVMAIYKGRPVDAEGHWMRLERSLAELEIDAPMSRAALDFIARQVVFRNRITNGTVYVQVTRGVAPRNHLFPPDGTPPALVMTARAGLGPRPEVAERGVSVVSQPDIRWGRRDIKSVSLLPNVLAKEKAHELGGFEALLVDANGLVSECSSANAWIVSAAGALVTRPLGQDILPGITRHRLRDLAVERGYPVEERSFTLDEAKTAREVFLTSTSSFCMPVVRVDDAVIGDGRPGPLAKALRACYIEYLDSLSGPKWYGH
ncbi:D-amino-acid transaminase [Pararhodospirillum oryzae]|uniref:Probable branched-chain-amino-acid aminotransferase n=1 Tax=Pararhodospirillum oryzae TaxID=478448 RepID=A0A512H377_9PROT|nr:D-amino-acid transaminase [Pararhodospirillum oryzae]GEO79914.1 D-amino-acid transaminase [Pararhodospirillum oryzae]